MIAPKLSIVLAAMGMDLHALVVRVAEDILAGRREREEQIERDRWADDGGAMRGDS